MKTAAQDYITKSTYPLIIKSLQKEPNKLLFANVSSFQLHQLDIHIEGGIRS